MMQAVSPPPPAPAPAPLPAGEARYSGIVPRLYNSFGGNDRAYYVKLRDDDEDVGFLGKKKSRKKSSAIRMGGGSRRKTRFAAVPKRMRFRIRLARPKIRLGFLSSLLSPIKLLRRLRDAYVNMMLSLASKGDFSGAVLGNAVYVPSGQPCRRPIGGIDSRKEDEILAYIDYLRRSGKLLPDPVLDR